MQILMLFLKRSKCLAYGTQPAMILRCISLSWLFSLRLLCCPSVSFNIFYHWYVHFLCYVCSFPLTQELIQPSRKDSAKRKDLGTMTATQSEHNTLKHMLTDSIMDVCGRGLCHSGCWTVDALLGIRLDDGRVFIVNIQKTHSPAETVLSGHSTTQTCNTDDDDTSLDMHVDDITDVKQGRVGNNVGERRSKRLENKQMVSRRSGSSKVTTQVRSAYGYNAVLAI